MNPSDEITFFCPVSETDITQPICDAIVQGIEHNDFACGEIPAQAEANQAQCQRCPRSPFVARNNARIDEAIIFAVKRHAGGLRKGTTLPYILHPLEVLQILSNIDVYKRQHSGWACPLPLCAALPRLPYWRRQENIPPTPYDSSCSCHLSCR